MRVSPSEMNPSFQRFIRENMSNRAVTFYYKQAENGIMIHTYHVGIWNLIDLAEQTYGWAALHGKGNPIIRVDESLSSFLIRGAKIC